MNTGGTGTRGTTAATRGKHHAEDGNDAKIRQERLFVQRKGETHQEPTFQTRGNVVQRTEQLSLSRGLLLTLVLVRCEKYDDFIRMTYHPDKMMAETD